MSAIRSTSTSVPPASVGSRSRALSYSIGMMVFALALVTCLLAAGLTVTLNSDSLLTLLSFLAIGVISFVGLYKTTAERPFSLGSSHWVFVIFFFFLAALIQYMTHQHPVQNEVGAFDAEVLYANALILLWCVFYMASYHYMFRRTQAKPQAPALENRQESPNYFLLIGLIGFATLVSIAVYGFTGLMSRYDASQASSSMDSPVQGVIGHFCRYVTILSFCLIIMHKRPKGLMYWIALVIAAAASFLTDDPISVPRFLAGTLGLAVITTFLRRKRMSGIWLPIVLIGGLIMVMPVLNLARRTSLSQINWSAYSPADVTTTLSDGDFDAYQMLCDTIHMPGDQITWGYQLYGNLLFFIPRSIWTSKPVSSGNLVGNYYELGYVNFSEPLPAEGYINFGVPGVILFAVLCGLLFGWTDAAYWKQMDTRPDTIGPTSLQLVYVFMVGLVIYTMRGALLAAIPDIAAFIAGAWLVVRIAYPDLLLRRRKAVAPYGVLSPAIDRDNGLISMGGDHRN